MPISLPEHFRHFFEASLETWVPGAKYSVIKVLDGGRTPASVSLVDIVSAGDLSGQYILKAQRKADIWDTTFEHERHDAARQWSGDFGKKHIPKLIRHAEDDTNIGILYETAGYSLTTVVTADSVEAAILQRYGRRLANALLSEMNVRYTIEADVSAKATLELWLGYRIDPKEAPDLHLFVKEELHSDGAVIVGDRLLVNPLWLCLSSAIEKSIGVRFSGLLHGDLHPGNLMIARESTAAESFWLIDFALSGEAPLFYDHAYFELAILINTLDGRGRERIIGVLSALD